MIRIIASLFLIITFITPANASSCYTMNEAEAEQGIRIQSELMVIGLNCQHKVNGIYNKYRELANNNSKLFMSYNQTMIKHFKQSGVKNTEAEINSMRTKYANKISKIAAELRPDIFCSKYASRIEKASAMDKAQIRKWATTFFPSHPVSKPLCKL